jgi:GH24 family phage-related lysozyme (muramidase)
VHVTSWEVVIPPGLGAPGGMATRASVVDAFPATQKEWEGYESNMYTDSLGFVTTGIGNKIDDNSPTNSAPGINGYGPALLLPWVHKSDGQPATHDEIIQDWQTVKNAHKASGTYDATNDRKITQLKLSDLAIQDLVASRLADNEKELIKSLPHFADAPADAQMATHGMAWAMGAGFIPGYGFKSFADAFNRGDWAAAKANSNFKGAAPKRKAAQDLMFDNAATVAANKLNPNTFWYPASAPTSVVGSFLAALRRPVVAASLAVGIVVVGGGIYYLATAPVRRRLPARAS